MDAPQQETPFRNRPRRATSKALVVVDEDDTRQRRGITARPFFILRRGRYLASWTDPSFPRLRYLALYSGCLHEIVVPCGFQHTLKHLSLRDCHTTVNTLVTSIDYFPNLDHLKIHNLSHEAGRQLTLPLSRALQKLSVSEPKTRDTLGIRDQLLQLRLQCDEVSIDIDPFMTPLLLQCVVDDIGASVQRLKPKTRFDCMCSVLKSSRAATE